MSDKILVEIFRTRKKEGMYLYLKKGQDLDELPESLLKQFGRPESAMTLLLEPGRKLANADVLKVIESLKSQKFYLQMPPSLELIKSIPNEKMPHQAI